MLSFKYLIAVIASIPLILSTPSDSHAVEDFRVAIKSIVPHLVVVRHRRVEKPSEGPDTKKDAQEDGELEADKEDSRSADAAILELLRSRRDSEDFQHAFRVSDDLIATIDSTADFVELKTGETRWELLTRDGKWHELSLAAYDKVSRLVILRSSEELLDKIASGSPVEGAVPVGHWIDGILEMGLPTVVVWYEEGAPRAKATMIAATGNAMTRGMAVLDYRFSPTQVGAPVLDADGRLLGLIAMEHSRRSSPELKDRFEFRGSPSKLVRQADKDESSPATANAEEIPTTVFLRAAMQEQDECAELIVPVNILNRLVKDVEKSDELVVLDFGMIGVRLGNGDATIRRVISGGAAAEKDCQSGDRILSINGQKVRNDGDIFNLVTTYRAGDTLSLEIQSPESTVLASTEKAINAEAENNDTIREIEITMRGIRTRGRSSSESDRTKESSWLESNSPLHETRLVGVVREGNEEAAAEDESLSRKDILKLQAEIEALLEKLNQQEK